MDVNESASAKDLKSKSLGLRREKTLDNAKKNIAKIDPQEDSKDYCFLFPLFIIHLLKTLPRKRLIR